MGIIISTEPQQIKQMLLSLRVEAQEHIHNMEAKIAVELQGLHTCYVHILAPNQKKVLKFAKLKYFDQWLTKTTTTKERVIAKQMFNRVTTKIYHMLKSF